MSKSKLRRAGVLAGELLLLAAAEILDLSYRQTKRIASGERGGVILGSRPELLPSSGHHNRN